MKKLIECVPNFSEGRNLSIIKKITDTIERAEGIRLLHVDRGHGANRTVVTFAGEPDEVVEAAFLAIQRASELIDMRYHHGEHPRFGATDVCPLIPISNITMEETVELARKLARRVGNELNIPVYCYEFAAYTERRRSLSHSRSGEYEGLTDKMKMAEWQPDFGPVDYNIQSGATAIGARNFLIAYNVNLDTSSVEIAKSIAADVREAGKIIRAKDQITGKIIQDKIGEPERIPGTLKKVRAIGWRIKEYGIVQVSMNLTDINVTPMHRAFEEVCEKALQNGTSVTGSELIGLVPLKAMLDAGIHFLKKKHLSIHISEREIIQSAIESLRLDELTPFDPENRIIEYLLDES